MEREETFETTIGDLVVALTEETALSAWHSQVAEAAETPLV